MNKPRIRTGHAPGEVSPNTFADFDWAREHRDELLKKYREATVLIYEKQVIGVGQTLTEVETDAASRLPADFEGELTPITYYLSGPLISGYFRRVENNGTEKIIRLTMK